MATRSELVLILTATQHKAMEQRHELGVWTKPTSHSWLATCMVCGGTVQVVNLSGPGQHKLIDKDILEERCTE